MLRGYEIRYLTNPQKVWNTQKKKKKLDKRNLKIKVQSKSYGQKKKKKSMSVEGGAASVATPA